MHYCHSCHSCQHKGLLSSQKCHHLSSSSTSSRITITLSLITLTLSCLISVSDAQSFQPVGTRRIGFATINDALYIQGGYDQEASSQFISLDLSTSWTTSSASWTKLPDGQSSTHLALAPISSASNGGPKGTILAIGGVGKNTEFFTTFDIDSSTWNLQSTVKPPYPELEGHAAVSDPNTGLIYIIGGFGRTNSNTTYNQFSVYDPKSGKLVTQQSASADSSVTDLTAAFISSRNSIITLGGTRAPPASVAALESEEFNEYDIASRTWKTMSTSGDKPPARLDHCMAASEDGSTVVVFGGAADNNLFYNTIYILDVKSGKWRQGQPAPVARTRMACALHSHQFIAWGGSSGSARSTMLNSLPIVYNLNQDKWTDEYSVGEKKESSSTGTIIGALVAFCALVGLGAFLVVRWRRKKREANGTAYRPDAFVAAASSEDDSNIKVQVSSSTVASSPHTPAAPAAIDGMGDGGYHGCYANNEYPLNKMEGYHSPNIPVDPQQHQYYHTPMVAHNAPVGGYGSEKYMGDGSPYGAHSSPYMMSSPATHYGGSVAASGVQSPPTVYQSHANDSNPFVSPDEFHSGPGYHQNMPSPSPNPFMASSASVAVKATATEYYHHPPPSSHYNSSHVSPYDPFYQQGYQASSTTWPATTMYPVQQSPSPGARAPQVIIENNDNNSSVDNNKKASNDGYVPPPL